MVALVGWGLAALVAALAKALPEEPQFAILTALAVAGPEHLWRENELPQLIELTKAMAKDLDRYYHPVGNTRSREDAALDFTVAWLLQGACPAPRAYQLVEIDVLGTIELILKWLSAEVPNFAESAGDAGTLAGAVLSVAPVRAGE